MDHHANILRGGDRASIHTVTVIGAGGVMGALLSGFFAAYGGLRVYMVNRTPERGAAAVGRAVRSVRGSSIASRLIPIPFDRLEEAVADSDLVFESVAEDLSIKTALLTRAAGALRPGAWLCTGTSGLSVTALAEALPAEVRPRFFGMHFFDPPGKMPLCELIPTPDTDRALLGQARQWLETALLRQVVMVEDRPAFLANRIGLYFLNRVAILADTYRARGGIDYVDAIFGGYTGRAMSPSSTVDLIGLDVHAAILRNLRENTGDCVHDDFILPPYLEELIRRGALGNKTRGGLFRRATGEGEDGTPRREVYDIETGCYRPIQAYSFPFVEAMGVCLRDGDYAGAFSALLEDPSDEAIICRDMIGRYLLYAAVTAAEVGCSLRDADVAMATGFNWCPPLAWIDALRTVDPNPLARLCEPLCTCGQLRDALSYLRAGEERRSAGARLSAFDYRPYFRV